jgi:hypothetical protein
MQYILEILMSHHYEIYENSVYFSIILVYNTRK